MKKNVLGKGLQALIPEKDEGRIHKVDISRVSPSKYQARTTFNDDSIKSLAETIKKDGIFQPLLVLPSGTGWNLIAGERRLRAAKIAGLKKVPVIIRDSADGDVAFISLIENLQREDLNPLEEARGISAIIKKFSLTQEEVALRIGKSRSTVANTLRLLKFPSDLVTALGEGTITEGHARALSSVKDDKKRKYLLGRVIKEHLSVRETESLTFGRKKMKPKKKSSAEVSELVEKLESALATKVDMKSNKKYQGFMKIHFFSAEELERLMKKITG